MFLSFTLVPVLQDNEIGAGITLFPASHDREAGYADIIFHFGIAVEDFIDLTSDSFCTFQT